MLPFGTTYINVLPAFAIEPLNTPVVTRSKKIERSLTIIRSADRSLFQLN
jgi:hypothetical protein